MSTDRNISRPAKPRAMAPGFTMIELMVAMAILAILAALTVPRIFSFMRTAREASVKSNMHTLQITVEDFALDNETDYPVSADDLLPDGRKLADLCPENDFPKNPFTQAPSVVQFNQRPTTGHPGELAIDPANVDAYAIRGNGHSGDSLSIVLTSAL